MSNEQIGFALLCTLVGFAAYVAGSIIGEEKQKTLWRDHMEKASRYTWAVDDLDRWCGHVSPHARLIARHLKAMGEGKSHNAGTPHADEACTIDGLREQLKRLDAALAEQQEGSR